MELLAIQLPQWLTDFWATYKDIVTPILVTILSIFLTTVSIWLKKKEAQKTAEANAQLEVLNSIANKENVSPQVEAINKEITELKNTIQVLAQIIRVAFLNTTLPQEVKDRLETLCNKIENSSYEELIEDLREEKEKLKEQVDALQNEIDKLKEPEETQKEEKVETVRV